MMVRYQRDLIYEFTRHLEDGERILWTGMPKQGLILKKSDAFLIPFSLLWGGFAIFWEYTAIESGAPIIFILFGIPFVLLGLYLIIGRFLYGISRRRKTFYAVTNRRILKKKGVIKNVIRSVYIDSISNVTLSEKADGTGTITFRSDPKSNKLHQAVNPEEKIRQIPAALESIYDAKSVYGKIMDVKKKD